MLLFSKIIDFFFVSFKQWICKCIHWIIYLIHLSLFFRFIACVYNICNSIPKIHPISAFCIHLSSFKVGSKETMDESNLSSSNTQVCFCLHLLGSRIMLLILIFSLHLQILNFWLSIKIWNYVIVDSVNTKSTSFQNYWLSNVLNLMSLFPSTIAASFLIV